MTPPAEVPVPALEVRDLTLRFGAVHALDEVSFEVGVGELVAVIGPNGAGKTSLFNLISRIVRPTGGELRYFGRDLLALRAHRLAGQGIARTFQHLGLFAPLTALDNVLVGRGPAHGRRSGLVAAGLRTARVRREEGDSRQRAMEALARAGAAGVAGVVAGTLPYGVQKRVELARALVMEPRLLLLDEPVAGMSRTERDEMTELLAGLRGGRTEANPLTVLLVEHDMGVVMGLADRVVVLDFGRVIASGAPATVQADPNVLRAYLGEPLQLPGGARAGTAEPGTGAAGSGAGAVSG